MRLSDGPSTMSFHILPEKNTFLETHCHTSSPEQENIFSVCLLFNINQGLDLAMDCLFSLCEVFFFLFVHSTFIFASIYRYISSLLGDILAVMWFKCGYTVKRPCHIVRILTKQINC